MDSSHKNHWVLRLERFVPWVLTAVIGLLFLPTWVRHIHRTIDPFTFNDDARILIWPFLRQADPSLFPQDPFIPYYQAGLPEGYLALYRMLALLGWVRPASEALQYLSVLGVLTLLTITARRLGGWVAAFLAAVLTLGSDSFLDRAGGGLPRAFAFPLAAAGLYALVAARPMLLAVLAVLAAAFYPVVAALLGASLFVLLVLPSQLRSPPEPSTRDHDSFWSSGSPTHTAWSWQRRGVLLVATLCGIVLLLIPMTLRLRQYGDAIGPALLPGFPEAAWGGRLSPEHHPPFESFLTAALRHARLALLGAGEPLGSFAGRWIRGTEQRITVVLLAAGAWAALRTLRQSWRRPELLRIWILPCVACLLHPLACLLAPRLFLPERYVQFAVPPFAVLLLAVGFSVDADRAAARSWKQGWKHVLAGSLLLLLAGRGTSWVGIEVHVPQPERALYAAVAELPKDVLIAGWPIGPLENIPYLTERRVLTDYQLEMPFHTRFTLESRARLSALFEAYFASAPEPIERLCSEYHVTHLLIDDAHFEHPAPDYYEPHRAEVTRLHGAGSGKFLLPTLLARNPSTRHFAGGLRFVELSRVPELAARCAGTLAYEPAGLERP